ncbi:hypothetical protein [Streptomyces globisporus]|uniref:hypothetical protein n=1 Tax=Streptomyces globisporus TaxID=1908 RepID=UPI001F0C1666
MTTFTLRRALTVATTGLLLAATACSEGSSAEQAPTTSAVSSSAPASPPASASASPPGSDRSTPMDIRVTIDGQEVEATLNDSPAARDLASSFRSPWTWRTSTGPSGSRTRRGS